MRTLPKAKAGQLLDRNSWFIGMDRSVGCLKRFMPNLARVYAFQILKSRADSTFDDKLNDSARVYLLAVKSGGLKESLGSWGAPPHLPSLHTFHKHVVSYLFTLHCDHSMSDFPRPLPYTD